MSQYHYFLKPTVTNTSFANSTYYYFGFVTSGIKLYLESGGPVQYSFDGVNVDGDMTTGQSSATLNLDNISESGIYLRVTSGSAVVRVEAWSRP